jgi:hypothetical protein
MITVVQLGQTFEMHPMKGPMTTQTLKGLPGLTPLHWRGDKANFLEFNGAFEGLMGGTEIPTIDMLAFATFINTILFQPNPNQNLDRTLKTSLNGGNAVEGREVFLTVPRTRLQGGILTCNGCHKANPGAGTNRLIGLSTPQPLKIPQLRNIYQKDLFTRLDGVTIDGFGLDHEGHVSGFGDFFESAIFATYTERQKRDIAAFVMSFDTGTAPAVGYTITLAPENADDELLQADWTTLQQQAAARNIDVTVKGTVDGQVRELSYRPFFDDYAVSGVAGAFRTRAQLQAGIDRGDILTIIGVPPREGISGSVAASSTDDPATTVEISQRGKNRGH